MRQPVFKQAWGFYGATGQQPCPTGVQRFFKGITVVFANAAFGKHAVKTLARGLCLARFKGQRAHRQQGKLVAALKRTLGFGIKKPHFFQRVAKKFQAHGPRIASGIQVHNIAAPGHFAGARDHGNPLVAPFHGLLEQQLWRVIAALAYFERAGMKKIDRHVAQQQALYADHKHAGSAQAQGIQGSQTGRPRGFVLPLAQGWQAQAGLLPNRAHMARICQRNFGRKKSGEGSGRVEFFAGAGHKGHAAPFVQSLTGKAAARNHAAAFQIYLPVVA